jgi:hypothetical protein
VTLAALLLGAGLVGALVSVSMDIGRKAGTQLEAYGANILILPLNGFQGAQGESASYLPEDRLAILQSQQDAGGLYYSPYLFGVVEASGKKAVLGGARLDLDRCHRR